MRQVPTSAVVQWYEQTESLGVDTLGPVRVRVRVRVRDAQSPESLKRGVFVH